MSTQKTVAVVGLGLIGGSVARGLAAQGNLVLGYDTNSASLNAALSSGVLTRPLSPTLEEIGDADAVIIAVYGDSALDVLERVSANADDVGLVTDVGSTKRGIVAAAEAMPVGRLFVGSHPLAGDHRAGWAASRADLFANATVYLCPARQASDSALSRARALWISLGAKPVEIEAGAHDDLLAWTSHLPHLVSIALAIALEEAGISRSQLGPGGRDLTRLAGGSPDVWTPIILENAAAIESAVEGIERQLMVIRKFLHTGDRKVVRERLANAQSWAGSCPDLDIAGSSPVARSL